MRHMVRGRHLCSILPGTPDVYTYRRDAREVIGFLVCFSPCSCTGWWFSCLPKIDIDGTLSLATLLALSSLSLHRLGPPSESGRELQPRGFFTGFSPAPICRNWEGVGNAVRTEFITCLLCDYRGSTDDAHEPRDARISYLASRRRLLLLGGIAGYGIYPTNALA